jgi:hypothetical protein
LTFVVDDFSRANGVRGKEITGSSAGRGAIMDAIVRLRS